MPFVLPSRSCHPSFCSGPISKSTRNGSGATASATSTRAPDIRWPGVASGDVGHRVRELSRGADRAKRWARLKPLFDLSLLKMNSGQLGADEQELAASPISRGSTLIAMMQTADLREGNNIACRGKLYATRPRAVLFEREMRSGVMMILKIARQY